MTKPTPQDQMFPLRAATRSWSRTRMHMHALPFHLSVSCYVFLLHSLSALTTDGVLIKSSRNRTVGKHCRVCQFHNCWGLIQPLTCCIQIGREPTVLAPTGRDPLARSWGVLQQRASLQKVNHSSCHASWHWGWRTLPSGSSSNMAIGSFRDEMAFGKKKSSLFKRKKWIHIKLIIILFTGLVYAKIILGASFCNGLLVSVLSSLIPTLNGIYSLSLLCANGNLNSLDLAKKMHALICLPHWGRVTSFGYLFELFQLSCFFASCRNRFSTLSQIYSEKDASRADDSNIQMLDVYPSPKSPGTTE